MTLRTLFGSKILASREALNLTQEQAAETFSISTRWFQEIEKGSHLPGNKVMMHMMIFFKIDPQDFSKEVELK